MTSNNLPFLLFRVKGGLYGINSEHVLEIVRMPNVVKVPNLPPQIRGVINLRGQMLELFDLRVQFGFPTLDQEKEDLIQLLRDREQDHRDWLRELEACVREKRPFNMARDPHACKYGRWRDTFTTDNALLRMALQRMDAPHQRIHATADEVLNLSGSGRTEAALELLTRRRSQELAEMILLFEHSRTLLREHRRELAIVLGRGEKRYAISVDLIEAVEKIPERNLEPLGAEMTGARKQIRFAKRERNGQMIVVLDEDSCFPTAA